jgi:hypothetical protein
MNQTVCRGSRLLGAIDAISKAIPHTNVAAKQVQREAESLQHHFGCPIFHLTVTPDDDNHFLIQVFSQSIIDTNESIADLSDNKELYEQAKKRTELGIKFPGICAFFFELALDIIVKEVIGWDHQKQIPMEGRTLLGKQNRCE